jgi:hypothetical protein
VCVFKIYYKHSTQYFGDLKVVPSGAEVRVCESVASVIMKVEQHWRLFNK